MRTLKIILSLTFICLGWTCEAAEDPGIRNDGINGAGPPIAGLTTDENALWTNGRLEFRRTEGITTGLGPRMNSDSCSSCHIQPAVGGTSPPTNNPQVVLFNSVLNHTTNTLPPFITLNGPVREARFPSVGGVRNLFTIAGLPGAEACTIMQPNFAAAAQRRDLIFRIPTPLFGVGLMEQIQDSTILANLANAAAVKQQLGIHGHVNRIGLLNLSPNDGTISRFGWKAQNASLLLFSGEALTVEMGLTNELFTQERDQTAACQFATEPNSVVHPELIGTFDLLNEMERLAFFMRTNAPPTPSTTIPGGADSIAHGATVFMQTGCGLCHTPALPTSDSSEITALRSQTAQLFSDLALHQMGNGLADGVTQGQAGPADFRTAPLWGLGKRAFFLHDGRTSDLLAAIRQHRGPGSEANAVIKFFEDLPDTAKQDLLNFLRSL
jgi:CxxC motif-containing protein (DUF1111 family)